MEAILESVRHALGIFLFWSFFNGNIPIPASFVYCLCGISCSLLLSIYLNDCLRWVFYSEFVVALCVCKNSSLTIPVFSLVCLSNYITIIILKDNIIIDMLGFTSHILLFVLCLYSMILFLFPFSCCL